MFFFLRDVIEFYYYDIIAYFIDFLDPFTLYVFFFDFFLFSFLPNDEFICRLYLLDDFEVDRFLLVTIFCCDNVFLFCFYVFLSLTTRLIKPFCPWCRGYCAFAFPLCRFLWRVICYFFFIFLFLTLVAIIIISLCFIVLFCLLK